MSVLFGFQAFRCSVNTFNHGQHSGKNQRKDKEPGARKNHGQAECAGENKTGYHGSKRRFGLLVISFMMMHHCNYAYNKSRYSQLVKHIFKLISLKRTGKRFNPA